MIGSDQVDIEGLSKGAVLAALYNSSPPLAIVAVIDNLRVGEPIGPRRGEELYRERGPRFRFLGARWLQVDLSGPAFDPTKYDEYLGERAAEAAIRPIREAGSDAWEIPTTEDGMDGGPFVRTEAAGALPNGSTVIKINTDTDDDEHLMLTGAVDGDRGIVLGSSLLPWGENGLPIPPVLVYYVEWDHDPRVAFAVLASCIAPCSEVGERGIQMVEIGRRSAVSTKTAAAFGARQDCTPEGG